MKINKIALTTVCAAVLAGTAHAAQDYYLYGSTAYRKATFTALQNLFNQTGNTLSDAWGETSAGKYENIAAAAAFSEGDSAVVISGTLANQGLGAVTIHATWAGSVGGEARLNHNDALLNTFITDVGAVAGNPVAFTAAHSPDFAMCDNQPGVTPFVAPTPGYSADHNIPVAVVDFVIAVNAGHFPAQMVNVSKWQLEALYKVGSAPLMQFTGNPSDNTNAIYAVGRDDDSGTRTIFETDTGLGVGAAVAQYYVTNTPSYGYISAGTTGINFPNDGDGYSSGGNVKNALQISNPGNYSNGDAFSIYNSMPSENASYAIGYLAVSDWSGSGLPILTYNGVAFSDAAVENGQYSYWGTENANVRLADWNANLNGIATLATAITGAQSALAGNPSNPGTLPIANLNCSRTTDGAVIFLQ
jgi:hypothetical protein